MASLADAEEVFRSTSTKANFQRLTRLLMCGGLRLLRETFDSIHSPADLPLRLGDPTIEAQLRGARLTLPEWNCLYPSPGKYGKSTDFDITLTFRLLRTICNLTPPPGPRGWDNLPNSSDHSLEADLVRIKYYRNEVYGHNKTMEITDTEFVQLWGKISEALIRIAAAISHEKKDEWKNSIDNYLHKPLTPAEERYIEELNVWYKQDIDVKTEVEKLTEKFETMAEYMKEGFARQSQRHSSVIIVVNITESITSTGSSGRSQIPHESGESQGIYAIPVPDQEGMDDISDHDTPTEMHIWTVILSFKKSVELFFQYLGYTLRTFVRNHSVGSWLITVECSSLKILQGLWEDYRSGHLNAIAQEILVTAEVLEKLGLDEVRLKTFISEEEYEKGKQIFMDHSEIQNVVPTSEECDPVDKQRVESLLESRAPVDLREPGSPQIMAQAQALRKDLLTRKLRNYSVKYVKISEAEMSESRSLVNQYIEGQVMKYCLEKSTLPILRLEYTESVYERLKTEAAEEVNVMVVLQTTKSEVVLEVAEVLGYVRLKARSDSKFRTRDYASAEGYINPERLRNGWFYGLVVQAVNNFRAPNVSMVVRSHGPAVQLDIVRKGTNQRLLSADLVPCFQIGHDSYYVAKPYTGRKQVSNRDLLWRQSFSLKEKRILEYMDRDFGCRHELLRILKTIVKKNPTYFRSLESYHLKTAFMHYMKKEVQKWYGESALGKHFLGFLRALQSYLEEGSLPHYWLPGVNLLEDINPVVTRNMADRLKRILNSEVEMSRILA